MTLFEVLYCLISTDRLKHEGLPLCASQYIQVSTLPFPFELRTCCLSLSHIKLSIQDFALAMHTPTSTSYPALIHIRTLARLSKTILMKIKGADLERFLLPSCPVNPGCCPAICRGSHQRKGQHCQLQVHNTTLQT